ncbi:MAG: ArnT family glycosyltransferase [Acidobacteriota bacterium]
MRKDHFLFIAAVAISGTVLLLYATRFGIGLSPDSTGYMAGARSFLAGHGLYAYSSSRTANGAMGPITAVPPLYPILLALVSYLGPETLEAARWLSAVTFGANILLVGCLVNRLSQGSVWATALALLLMLGSIDMIEIHSMAWTEPPFIFFALLGLWLLAKHIEKPDWRILLAGSGAVGLAFATRYAGNALVLTGALGLLVMGSRPYKEKLRDAVVFGRTPLTASGVLLDTTCSANCCQGIPGRKPTC